MRITWRTAVAFTMGIGLAVGIIGQPTGPCSLLSPAPAMGADDPTPGRISTSGTATIRVKPDNARVFFKVTKSEKTVAGARAASAKATSEVMGALEALGIEDMFTKTSTVEFQILRTSHTSLDDQIKGYRMSTVFTVRVVNDDVEALAKSAGRIVDVALQAGANEIQQISFFKEDDATERRECLKKAVVEARKNAEALAEAAGVVLKGAIQVSGRPQYGYFGAHNRMMVQSMAPMGGGGEASSFSPGDVEIRCEVSATFAF